MFRVTIALIASCLIACVDPEITELDADPTPSQVPAGEPDDAAICRKIAREAVPATPAPGLDNLGRVAPLGEDETPCGVIDRDDTSEPEDRTR